MEQSVFHEAAILQIRFINMPRCAMANTQVHKSLPSRNDSKPRQVSIYCLRHSNKILWIQVRYAQRSLPCTNFCPRKVLLHPFKQELFYLPSSCVFRYHLGKCFIHQLSQSSPPNCSLKLVRTEPILTA
jgi:hypothetical protein